MILCFYLAKKLKVPYYRPNKVYFMLPRETAIGAALKFSRITCIHRIDYALDDEIVGTVESE